MRIIRSRKVRKSRPNLCLIGLKHTKVDGTYRIEIEINQKVVPHGRFKHQVQHFLAKEIVAHGYFLHTVEG
jgi:hypothetical protein